MRVALCLLPLLLSCKKPGNQVTPDAGAAIIATKPDAGANDAASPSKVTAASSRDASSSRRPSNVGFNISRLTVSSRVDNETEAPQNMWDFDPATAWSSKTGELEGAWVEMLVRGNAAIKTVVLTVGMTKPVMPDEDDLFLQNPRIAEASLTWTPVKTVPNEKGRNVDKLGETITIVERFKLDPDVREEQSIPIPVKIEPPGVLRLTVKKVKLGTKPQWREVSISELGLLDAWTAESKIPDTYGVGPIDPSTFKGNPRGLLGIVPEEQPTFGCYAYIPSTSRAYCIVGHSIRGGVKNVEAELDAIEVARTETIATLVDSKPESQVGDFIVPFGSWTRTEKVLREKSARPTALAASLAKASPSAATPPSLPTSLKSIPWSGSIEINGVTFRQRETENVPKSEDDPPVIKGVVEVRWPGETAFKTILKGFPIAATSPMLATVEQIGTHWLVERRMTHGSEGVFGEGAEATVCDFSAKKCAE